MPLYPAMKPWKNISRNPSEIHGKKKDFLKKLIGKPLTHYEFQNEFPKQSEKKIPKNPEEYANMRINF